MEELLEAQGGSLGLNIVCEDQPSPVRPKKRVKKYNKYEKRRAKARKARGLDTDDRKRETDAIAKQEMTKQDETSNPVKETEEMIESEQQNGSEMETEASPEEPARADHEQETSIASPPTSLQHAPPQQPVLPPSRKIHADSFQNEEERARYMREFHARPAEMDRRSGASSTILPSKESSHLFEKNETDNKNVFQTSLHARLGSSLTKMGVTQPTIIQTRAIQALQSHSNCNLFIQSETGSGKTLAYLLPILQSLAIDEYTNKIKQVDRQVGGTRCIVLCPTRELATQTLQIAESLTQHSFRWIVPGCLSGGEKRKSEKARIRKGISILIATPGRLLDHLQKTDALLMSLKGKLEWLVLDEADRLLDMGLGGQVEQILQIVRANQPKSGPKRNGVTWRSVLVSATVTHRVEELARKMLGGDEWLWARGDTGTENEQQRQQDSTLNGSNELQLASSTPRQLGQQHITVSAKLRLATLIAFLVQRVERNERTVVFMSTCDGVDYHEALFTAMDSILSSNDDNDDVESGIFGKTCPIYKLHGNVPHTERNSILRKFGKDAGSSTHRAALLLATDVAARGLNLPGVDWTVQYDPPCEVADYAHRAGRTARAGKAGHSLLFLLPSERAFLDVLEMKGLEGMAALSLTTTLNEAAKICSELKQDGEMRSGGGYGQSKAGRSGEAFCAEIQRRLEDVVMEDDAKAKSDAAAETAKAVALGGNKKRKKKEKVNGRLLEMARSAYTSYLRSYPTKEKAVRHIFSTRALHLGHVARSFALKEPPKALVKAQARGSESTFGTAGNRKRTNASLAFSEGNDSEIARLVVAKKPKHSREAAVSAGEKRIDNKEARALLHERATRLQGMDAM